MWLDRQKNILIYKTDDDRLAKATSGAFSLLPGYTAFPATLYNMQVARWLGFPTPSPLEIAEYDWPGRFRPYDHQVVTANFLALNPRAFCLNDMGTGKTNAVAWAADFVMQQYTEGTCRALVVAPLSILQRAWGDAIFTSLLGRRTFTILHGTPEQRRKRLAQPHDFYIINHDGFKNTAPQGNKPIKDGLFKDLMDRTDIRMVIIDEAGAFRDATSARSKAMRRLLANKDYVWPLTGSPTPTAPTDAYGLAKLVNNAKGETFTSFKGRTMYNIHGFKWVPRTNGYEEAAKLLQPAIRYAIEDCIDLPPCDYLLRDAELSADQAKAHKKLRDEAVLYSTDGKTITAANEAVLRSKLIQIACGAVYATDHAVHHIDATPRINLCREVMEESRNKTIIFAPLTSVLELLYSKLKGDASCAIINGSVSLTKRSQIFKDFQESDTPKVLIADPGTMAHGLTLTAADTIIWYCPVDKAEIYMQANRRINRPGQTRHTRIVKLAATKTEREIFRRLDNNESLQGAMLTLLEDNDNGY